MNKNYIDILRLCVTFWLYFYGVWLFSGKIFFDTCGSLSIACIIFAGLLYLRIPPVNKETVASVYGRDPFEKDNGSFFLRTGSHRGCGLDAPENTIPAFKYCIAKRVDLIEFDLCMTKDNVLCIFHDDSLARLTDDNRLISQVTWSDLCHLDVAQKHPFRNRFENTRIPTLDETLDLLLDSDVRFIIDLKVSNNKALEMLLDRFEKRPEMYHKAGISGFNPFAIYKIRSRNPKIVTSLAFRPHIFAYKEFSGGIPQGPRSDNYFIQKCLEFLDVIHAAFYPFIARSILGVSGVVLHKECINPQVVQYWRQRDVRLITWSVNAPYEKIWFIRGLKVAYLTDTLIGETSAHNACIQNGSSIHSSKNDTSFNNVQY